MHRSDTEAQTYDVAIVGYGPVGSVAANVAGQLGLRTLVVEPMRDVFPYPRAAHFDAEIMRLFQWLDLAPRMLAITARSQGMQFINGAGEELLRWDEPHVDGPLGWSSGYMFFQPTFERVLRDGVARFANVDVRLGRRVSAFEQNDEWVELSTVDESTSTPSTARARFVIGCDGANGVTRKAAGIEREDFGLLQRWLVVDTLLRTTKPLPRLAVGICDPRRPATLVPGAADHYRWECMLLDDERDEDMESPVRVSELLAPWVSPDEVEILRASIYRYRGTLAQPWRRDRLFVAGDAAHEMPPFVGQGMCSGFRDVKNLLWKIALVRRGIASASLLDTYEAERAPHVRDLIDASVRAAHMLTITDPETARARDAAMRLRAKTPASQRSNDTPLARLEKGLVIDTSAAGGRLQSGRPMPQPNVVSESRVARLDELMGTGFAVVGGSGTRAALSARTRIFLDRIGARTIELGPGTPIEIAAEPDIGAWAAGGGVAIVRPDRYLYAVSDSASDANGFAEALMRGLESGPTVTEEQQ